jgi:nucleoside-diphosphate-sugar epimerase
MVRIERAGRAVAHKFFANTGARREVTPMRNDHGRRLTIFGCGYVGEALARAALGRGVAVTALTRNPEKARALAELGVTPVVADLAEDDWHARVPGQPDWVVNCVSSGGGGLDGYRRSYVGGMESIVRWAAAAGPVGTFVYTGSTSVYPQGDGAIVTEAAGHEGVGERGRILLEAERCVRGATGAWTRWFVLRLAGIYGPGRHHLLEQVRTGAIAGHGDHRLNLIHRDDIVGAILTCLAAPPERAGGIFNVADDAPARKREAAAWLAERIGAPPPHFTGEPSGGRQAVTPDRTIVNAHLKAELGWSLRYPTFRDGYPAILRAAAAGG